MNDVEAVAADVNGGPQTVPAEVASKTEVVEPGLPVPPADDVGSDFPEARHKRRNAPPQVEKVWRGLVDEWHRLVAEAAAGGPAPTVRGFCEAHQLPEPNFYWWRREFAQRDGVKLPSGRAGHKPRHARNPGPRPAKANPTPAFVQLHVRSRPSEAIPQSTNAAFEVVVGKVVVRVSPGFDANELGRLLDVLHGR